MFLASSTTKQGKFWDQTWLLIVRAQSWVRKQCSSKIHSVFPWRDKQSGEELKGNLWVQMNEQTKQKSSEGRTNVFLSKLQLYRHSSRCFPLHKLSGCNICIKPGRWNLCAERWTCTHFPRPGSLQFCLVTPEGWTEFYFAQYVVFLKEVFGVRCSPQRWFTPQLQLQTSKAGQAWSSQIGFLSAITKSDGELCDRSSRSHEKFCASQLEICPVISPFSWTRQSIHVHTFPLQRWGSPSVSVKLYFIADVAIVPFHLDWCEWWQ